MFAAPIVRRYFRKPNSVFEFEGLWWIKATLAVVETIAIRRYETRPGMAPRIEEPARTTQFAPLRCADRGPMVRTAFAARKIGVRSAARPDRRSGVLLLGHGLSGFRGLNGSFLKGLYFILEPNDGSGGG